MDGGKMTDSEFWCEIRRGLLTIARALYLRYGWRGGILIFGGKITED